MGQRLDGAGGRDALRNALASLPVITFTATADGSIDWVSDRWYVVTGIPQDAVLGEAWAHVVHPDDVERIVWLWTRSLEEGVPWEATPRVRHGDGTYHLWYTRAERVGRERSAMWVGTTIEITEPVRRAVRDAANAPDAAATPASQAAAPES